MGVIYRINAKFYLNLIIFVDLDTRWLVDGGYRLTRMVPVDQFRFSPHIEVVAHLER